MAEMRDLKFYFASCDVHLSIYHLDFKSISGGAERYTSMQSHAYLFRNSKTQETLFYVLQATFSKAMTY